MNEQELLQSCERFIKLWHENGRASFERRNHNLVYDQYEEKFIKPRKLWICIDKGSQSHRSGVFMVRKTDGQVFEIKGYGVPNLRKPCGYIGDLITKFALANVDQREVSAVMLA